MAASTRSRSLPSPSPTGRRSSFLHRRIRGPVQAAAPALIHVMRLSGPRIKDRSPRFGLLTTLRAARVLGLWFFHGRNQSQLRLADKLRLSGVSMTLPWPERAWAYLLRDQIEKPMKCLVCEDTGCGCEVHPDQPWQGPHGCICGGAGAPCPRCNAATAEVPPRLPKGFKPDDSDNG